jgi:hypothetical protein
MFSLAIRSRNSGAEKMTLTAGNNLETTVTNHSEMHMDAQAQANAYALPQAAQFVREYWRRLAAISALVLVPCFWHRRIIATDLGSHLYNAWLAHLIQRGQAPGLYLSGQWTNVLFDYMLSGFGDLFGLRVAEKIVVPLSVLIFFWGLFALVSAATRRAPWLLVPCLALVTFGWTFFMGFFNYYISLGFAFFGVAIIWRGKGWERLVALALVPLIVVAHPFGLIWLAGAGIYAMIAELTPRRYQIGLFLIGIGSIFLAHWYFWHRYIVEAPTGPFYFFNGADQLVIFGDRYKIPELALIAFVVIALAVDMMRRRREPGLWKYYGIPLQLYVIVWLGVILLPRGVRFEGHPAAIALLTERLTTVSAALACCMLGAMKPRKWHLAASLAVAAVFFTFLYQDTGIINNLEFQAEKLTGALPPDQRVLATIDGLSGYRVSIEHIIDQACVGHCFNYGNYEPGSQVFRVRATPGNPYVIADYGDATDTEEGNYVVQPDDLPIYQVFQCTDTGTTLCIRPLEAGEQNDRTGLSHQDDQ